MTSPEAPEAVTAQSSHAPPQLVDLQQLFRLAVEQGASDIHLTEHNPPMLRIDGSLQPTKMAVLSREETKRLIYGLLNDRQRAYFEHELELDFSFDMQGLGRVRVNVHLQRGAVEAAFRMIPSRIPTLQELGLPAVTAELVRKPNGLVLITGPTGMGKTTTLAAMVKLLNYDYPYHIVCIEDPIEYVHRNHRSIIKQREVYSDTKSFASALVHALRQDPNVIIVGEMRDLETIAIALTAAETGHLVLATLHTPDAAQTIDRIVDVFPPGRQQEVRIQLADCLQGVISQQLLPRSDARGRVLACEIMIATPAVRHLIREHATQQIRTLLQTGAAHGMCTMDACIKDLYDRKIVSYETAINRMQNPSEFHLLGKPGARNS